MSQRVIKIGSGYDGQATVFALRTITLAEENTFLNRFEEIADTEDATKKADQQFDILIDALASWSVEMPMIKNGDKKDKPAVEKADNPADAVRKYFQDKTGEKERIANQVVLNFRAKLSPTVVFL